MICICGCALYIQPVVPQSHVAGVRLCHCLGLGEGVENL